MSAHAVDRDECLAGPQVRRGEGDPRQDRPVELAARFELEALGEFGEAVRLGVLGAENGRNARLHDPPRYERITHAPTKHSTEAKGAATGAVAARIFWSAMSTSPRHAGLGRVLVAVYGVLAIAALGRSIFQIIDRFDEAPIAFTLSAVAAAVYVARDSRARLRLGSRRLGDHQLRARRRAPDRHDQPGRARPARARRDQPVRSRGDSVERLRRGLPVHPARRCRSSASSGCARSAP